MLCQRRGGVRKRAVGAGRKHTLGFTDRLLVTLVHLRHDLPHAALAELYDVDRSTISGAVRQVRPLLAGRGFAVPDHPGVRLRTLADVFAYAAAEGVTLRIDGTEVQVRRPRAGRIGRKAFVSGKKKQNTIKTTTFSDAQGRTLFSGAVRPGRMHDQTAVRTEGIAEQFRLHPKVKAEVDEGYRGLANEFSDQVSAPPKKPTDDADIGDRHVWRHQRRRQSSGGSAWNTPTPSTRNGGLYSATPAAAKPTPKPTWPSPDSSPTAPPNAPPDPRQAPNWYSSGQPPTDHPPTDPPAQHTPNSIAPQLVRCIRRRPKPTAR